MTNIQSNGISIFDHRSLDDIHAEIRELYRSQPYPWVVGYSGGKDSTAALQLVWNALAGLPVEERKKRVYVISSDTLVETPVIIDYINDSLRRMEKRAAELELPFEFHKLAPVLDDTFWVNLIGRGYPAPSSIFRWCTLRLKINASNRFILDKVAAHGEVILVLGVRKGESFKRDRVIKEHRFRGKRLEVHGQLPGAWVYMPIQDFSREDVWTYLLQVPSPWGGDNRSLASLYHTEQDGECPLVVDDTTPPCGNSRFGCWTCTVVDRDRSMEAMIDSGEEWMIPLLEFRDYLVSTQDPSVKPQQREFKGRDGRVRFRGEKFLWRTYTLQTSQEMLWRLLETQAQVQQFDPDYYLISESELREIRRLWLTERRDWDDSLPRIYTGATGQSLEWDYDDVSVPGRWELELLQRITPKHGVPVELPQKLIDTEWQHYGMRRRGSIHKTIEGVLNEDWCTLEELQAEIVRRQQDVKEMVDVE